jgi:hypothetical protein
MHPTEYHEDGLENNRNARYGHRLEAITTNERFLPDRARGTQYRGHDRPGVFFGDRVRWHLQFKGQSYDRCNDVFGPIHEWNVDYDGLLYRGQPGHPETIRRERERARQPSPTQGEAAPTGDAPPGSTTKHDTEGTTPTLTPLPSPTGGSTPTPMTRAQCLAGTARLDPGGRYDLAHGARPPLGLTRMAGSPGVPTISVVPTGTAVMATAR